MAMTVQLYRYDLTNGLAAQMAPMLIGRPLEGIWHTSIVVGGTEYYFDGGVGIVSGPAGATRFGPPLRSEVLGQTNKTIEAFEAWNAEEMRSKRFGPDSYNLMLCNCNHYSQAASQFLLGKDIPDDVRLMIPTLLETPLGRMIGPVIQQMVNAPGAGSGGIGATPFGMNLAPQQPQQHQHQQASTCSFSGANASSSAAGVTLDSDTQESLDIFIALISSDDAENEKKRITFEALERILMNIRNNPSNNQYKRISVSSEFFRTRVASPFEGAREILALAGFEPEGDTHLVFKGEVSRLEPFLVAIRDALGFIA